MKTKYSITLKGIMALALVAIAAQSCSDSVGKGSVIPKASEPVPVKIVSLEQSTSNNVIFVSGQLTTDDETTLGFKTGGVIKEIFVKEGDAVKKGQLLARLDLTEINAQVALARHGYEKAQRDFQRVSNLHKDSVATLEQLQNAQTGMSVAKEQLDAAAFNQSFSEIHAPANGYVLKKFVNAGQVVGTGDPIVMTNGAARGEWIIKAGVSDKQWAQVKTNDVATVQIDAFPGKSFKAVVVRKSEKADAQTGAFNIELKLADDHNTFASGMFASAALTAGQNTTSWSVPYEAVLDANDDQGFVFITNDQKTAVRQPVTIESFNGETIRISKGLENAQSLIVSGSPYLSDRSPIQIIK